MYFPFIINAFQIIELGIQIKAENVEKTCVKCLRIDCHKMSNELMVCFFLHDGTIYNYIVTAPAVLAI